MFCFCNEDHRGIWPTFSEIMLTYALEEDEIWQKQFSRVLSLGLHWENKTYKLSLEVYKSYK